MPNIHAKLSASGANRWINCPGSVKLEENIEDTSSEFAKEGTLAHEIAEIELRHWISGIISNQDKRRLEELKSDSMYNKLMQGHINDYTDYVKEIFLSYKNIPYVDIESRVDFSDVVPGGFGTADCIILADNELNIIDLKFGKGVEVSAEDNPQLMLYAIGAYTANSWIYDIDKISMHIVQPRINNYSKYTISVMDLITFANKVKPIAEEAFKGSDRLYPGEHCRFCKAKSVCRARARTMFSKVETVNEKRRNLNGVGTLTADDISTILIEVEGLDKWIADIEAEALKRALGGEDISGYKLVEGRSTRRFTDTDEAFKELIRHGIDEAMLYEKKPISLTACESLLGKKEFSAIMKDFIKKPEGKPTLVKESDKRKALVLNDASKMFNKVN